VRLIERMNFAHNNVPTRSSIRVQGQRRP
jgi:hypothetical protein